MSTTLKASVRNDEKIIPWWERSRTYGKMWRGPFFDNMVLKATDEEEQRIQKQRELVFARPPGKAGYLSVWRAKLMTDSYKETEGEAPILRKAKAFKHICEYIPIPYSEHQLLLGSAVSRLHGGEIEPEFMTTWLDREVYVEELEQTMKEIDALPVRTAEQWSISEEDLKTFKEYILPYWRKQCHQYILEKQMEENFPYVGWKNGHFPGRTSHPLVGWAVCHTIADYAGVLKKGLKGIKEEIQQEIKKIDGSDVPSNAELNRLNVYKAMLITADAIIIYANRCADLAEDMLAKETNTKRKAELTEMARICRTVPENPATSWWEAIFSWHLLRTGITICDGGGGHCTGRFDVYMYPYLKNDLEKGKISKKLAQAMIECLFLKIRERGYPAEYHRARRVPGLSGNEKVTIGGMDPQGKDVTNELSYMLLEAHAHVHSNDVVLSVRVYRDTPEAFLNAVLQVLRLGSGIPHIINDEAIVPSLTRLGVSLAEARNYADIGCQENATDPNTSGADTNPRSNAGYFNLPKMVHMALYNGMEKVTRVQAGPKTGEPESFKTMDDFFAAIKAQIEHAVRINCVYNNLMDWAWSEFHPSPALDLMHPGPRRKGIDYNNGGCKYNWTGAIGVGLGTAADSLAAIEWLVYDKKEVTFSQLIKAMDSNWKGYEDIREKCCQAPKYGKDDDYADKWAVNIARAWMDAYESHRTSHGGIFVCGFFSMSNYVQMGHDTWATADGRGTGEPLSSAIDPSNSVELEGPTKMHKSVAKIDTWRTTNGVTFNCRLTTAAVAGDRELAKWSDLVRTYVLLKGTSVQYTIVDGESLREAQKHPEKYTDLIVRTGGYSAFFVELSKEIQDSIIARTEHQL